MGLLDAYDWLMRQKGVGAPLLDAANQKSRYVMGPHLSQGVKPVAGAAALMSSGQDLQDMMSFSGSAMQNLGQGNVGGGLLDLGYAAAAPLGILAPGSVGMYRKGAEEVADGLLGVGRVADDLDPTMPAKYVNPEMRVFQGGRFDQGLLGDALPTDEASRTFYRGTNPGDTRRIDEPFAAASGMTFAARKPESAKMYGSSIEEIVSNPGARILDDESPEFWKLVGRRRPPNGYVGSARGGPVEVVNDAVTKAKAAGYDAVSFSSDSDIGTVILNEGAFTRRPHLPTDEASRMARAREMGLTTDAYHGTNATDIDSFKGPITWTSRAPGTASDYAIVKSARDWGGDTLGTVYPLKIKTERPLNLSFDANDRMTYAEFYEKSGIKFTPDKYTSVDVDGVPQNFDAWSIINTPEFADAARDAGFDGVVIKEGGKRTVGILDPKNIRSRFAKFDPAKKDSANILAGVGGGLLATGVAANSMRDDKKKKGLLYQ